MSVKGTVVRVSSIKPLCSTLAFSCLVCSNTQNVHQVEGRYTFPTSCIVQDCRSRSFVPDRSHKLTQTVDWQSFRIQEIISDDQVLYCTVLLLLLRIVKAPYFTKLASQL